jgi:hypothetical protein
MFVAMIIIEALHFLWVTFFGRPLWEALFRVSATAACVFILVIDITYVKPHIVRVMREPTLILFHDASLLVSNLLLAVAFIVAIVALIGTVWIRIPRRTSSVTIAIARQIATRRVIYSAIVVYICSCGATLTCFPVLNYLFGFDDARHNWPGVYTSLAITLGVFFTAMALRTRDAKDSE